MADGALANGPVLVTGATGYLGSMFAERLRQEGYRVRLLVRRLPSHLEAWLRQFDVVVGDVRDVDQVSKACAGATAVVHCAAANEVVCAQDPELALAVNVIGTCRVLAGAAAAGVRRFVYLSTFHVYGDAAGTITEETLPRPVTDYGITHLSAEHYARQSARKAGSDLTILRPSNGFGAPLDRRIDRWSLVLNDLSRQAVLNRRLVLKSDGYAKRDFLSLHDIGNALLLVLSADARALGDGLFNVGGDSVRSIREVAHLVADVYRHRYGDPVELVFPEPAGPPPEQDGALVYDCSRLKALGYRPQVDFEKEIAGLMQMSEAFRS